MAMNKVVVAGGGVLGTQIGLMCAYTGHDVTFWLRSESSIGRTKPKIEAFLQRADQGEEEMFETLNGQTGEREFFTPVRTEDGKEGYVRGDMVKMNNE